MTTAEKLEALKASTGRNWGNIAEMLGVSRQMLDFVRKGERNFSEPFEAKLEAMLMETEAQEKRTIAALLAANEALRREGASLRNSVESYRLEARRHEVASRAWMFTACAADGGLDVYTSAFQEAMKQVAAGTRDMRGVREVYDTARLYRAEDLSRRMQRQTVPVAASMRVAELEVAECESGKQGNRKGTES